MQYFRTTALMLPGSSHASSMRDVAFSLQSQELSHFLLYGNNDHIIIN